LNVYKKKIYRVLQDETVLVDSALGYLQLIVAHI